MWNFWCEYHPNTTAMEKSWFVGILNENIFQIMCKYHSIMINVVEIFTNLWINHLTLCVKWFAIITFQLATLNQMLWEFVHCTYTDWNPNISTGENIVGLLFDRIESIGKCLMFDNLCQIWATQLAMCVKCTFFFFSLLTLFLQTNKVSLSYINKSFVLLTLLSRDPPTRKIKKKVILDVW